MITKFRKVSSLCRYIKRNLRKSFNATSFDFSKYNGLTIEKTSDYQCLKDLYEDFQKFNKLIVSKYRQAQIDEVKTQAHLKLEDISDENVLFIMREGSLKDLDYFASLLTADVQNVNQAYDLMVHSEIMAQQSFDEYKYKVNYLLEKMKKKAKSSDKIVEYVVDIIIDKFKT